MNAPVVEARDLRRIYSIGGGLLRKSRPLYAVDGISFTLERGRTLAVVGESGSGKSTLGRLISMIEAPSAGTLIFDGKKPSSPRDRALRRSVQMVFQDPYSSLNPRKTVGAILAEPLAINTNLPAAERREAARAMLAKVGLRPDHDQRYPHMFSGGQRQRIAIARALMLNPGLVVADEPVSALDISIQAQVLNLLMDLQGEFGLAYLFISHDLSVVRHIADDVLVMYLGRTAEQGPKETIFAHPLHPYTRTLLAARPSIHATSQKPRHAVTGEPPSPLDPPSGCAFRTRCPFAIERCARERPALRSVEGRDVACHRAQEIEQISV